LELEDHRSAGDPETCQLEFHILDRDTNQEQQRRSDDPINVSHVEDLADVSSDLRITTLEFNLNTGPAKVGCHGEVSNGCNHGDGCGDVVEDTLLARLPEGQPHEGKGRDHHDRRHGPVPVGSMGGKMVSCDDRLAFRTEAVDVKRVIARHTRSGTRCW
jgi:hypothetical protein